MSVFGTSRFTALLAAVALSGTAGMFWWALGTRTDMKAVANNHTASRTLPVKAGSRVPRSKDEHPKVEVSKFDAGKPDPGNKEPNKFELMSRNEPTRYESDKYEPGKSERPQASLQSSGFGGRNEEAEQAPSRSLAPRLVNYPIPGQGSAPPGPASQGRADMPLPAMPALPAKPDPAPLPSSLPWRGQAKAADPPLAFAPPIPSSPPPPAEAQKRQTRDARPPEPPAAPAAAAPRLPKTQSFYTEQFIEQGEFRYRRRPCEPPNMPDVCFMPQANRHPIVVAKP
jgi:hypothetical protein